MEVLLGNYPALQGYGGALGQAASDMPPIDNGRPSARQVWEGLRITCRGLLGEDTCTRLLGYQPFICPTEPDDRPKGFTFKTVLIAAGIGVVVGKIIL